MDGGEDGWDTAFTDLLTEQVPSARYSAKLSEGYEDKSDKPTFQKIEEEISNTQANWRAGKSKCPKWRDEKVL